MPTIAEKSNFLQNQYLPLIKSISESTSPIFGKMNLQQMVEHMANSIRLAYGNPIVSTILTPEENIPRMQAFILSDKPFKDNTPNALLPEEPVAPLFKNIADSIADLEKSIVELFQAFSQNPNLIVINPFFGALNEEKTMSLLYKHALHHLRQFGLQNF
jgi:hypothetical protein